MEDATWTLVDGEARVQTQLSKIMLPAALNPEAEKLAKEAMRALGVMRWTVLPGASTAKAEKKPRTAKSGSAEARAREHPMVQEAQRLFEAEIQSVMDLSEDA